MLSLKLVREQPDLVRESLRQRGQTAPIDDILALDERRRQLLTESETLRARRKQTSAQIAKMKEKPESLIAEMREVGDRIKTLEAELAKVEEELNYLLLLVPNIPSSTIPVGPDASANVMVREWGTPRQFDFTPLPHWELGERLGIIDFERGVKLAGARSYVLRGNGARLERALIEFMLDTHTTRHGYVEVAVPYLVKREIMVGTGQLPKFEADMYRDDAEDLFLIPTAEVPVTNLHREEIIEPGTLPLYYVCYTACFRREAGAAGRETRGLIRVHQFDKVEMVKLVAPETSYDELEKLLGDAEDVLKALELSYRVMLLCTGDLGFSAAKTYDPEVWFPGLDRYVEISSCSNFEAFQARRANIRYRPAPGEPVQYVHTLNGSGLAVGRTLAAVMENYQQADGSIVVPEALRPYMHGVEVITGP